MSQAYDLAYYIANTLGKGTMAVNVFCNYMPDSPDNCIAVYAYGGSKSDKGMGSDTQPLENATLQVNVRNTNANTAEDTCVAIHKSLDELGTNVTINSNVYTWLNPLQPPFLLERDSKPRTTFVFNLECQRVRT
jgi:hypothetical protein